MVGSLAHILHAIVGNARERLPDLAGGAQGHGAGRRMSRTAALKLQHSQAVIAKLKRAGIYVRSAGKKTVAEEAPEAYKDVNDVVRICHGAGISRLVAKMRPLGVMKG